MGIDKYNAECRNIVMRYSSEWRQTVVRMGRWIDFDNDYKTLNISFMESVWWAFKQLFERGLVYRGLRVMPYSTGCTTPLSNFEAGLDYRDVSDPAGGFYSWYILLRFDLQWSINQSRLPSPWLMTRVLLFWRGRRRRGHCRLISPFASTPITPTSKSATRNAIRISFSTKSCLEPSTKTQRKQSSRSLASFRV